MQAAIVAGRCVVIVFPPRRYSYIQRSSVQRADTQSSNTHTHTYTHTHTDIHFDSSCLLTDDMSGMEIAHIPPTATAQSGPTGSLCDPSLLLSPPLFSFTPALTIFSFSLGPHQLLFPHFTWRTLGSNICTPNTEVELPKGPSSPHKGSWIFIIAMKGFWPSCHM